MLTMRQCRQSMQVGPLRAPVPDLLTIPGSLMNGLLMETKSAFPEPMTSLMSAMRRRGGRIAYSPAGKRPGGRMRSDSLGGL